MSNPIPQHLLPEFLAFMDMADDDDLPDGAWFAFLEENAAEFMKQHRLSGCPNSATHQWVQARSEEVKP